MNEEKEIIPIFFAIDDRYIPFMAVCLQSITEHLSEDKLYEIKVLYTKVSKENQEKIMKFERDNFK